MQHNVGREGIGTGFVGWDGVTLCQRARSARPLAFLFALGVAWVAPCGASPSAQAKQRQGNGTVRVLPYPYKRRMGPPPWSAVIWPWKRWTWGMPHRGALPTNDSPGIGSGGGVTGGTSVSEGSGVGTLTSGSGGIVIIGGGGSGTTNPSNGNRLTPLHLVGWIARGGMVVSMDLAHNSQGDLDGGSVGQKWCHSLNMGGFKIDAIGDINLKLGLGAWEVFKGLGNGQYASPSGNYDTLSENPATHALTLTTRDHLTYRFHGNYVDGQVFYYCDTVTDNHSNVVTLTYNGPSGKLGLVTDPTGRTLTFTYKTVGGLDYVSEVDDTLGRAFKLFYNANGSLSQVAYPTGDQPRETVMLGEFVNTGPIFSFGYNANFDLTSVSPPGAALITMDYDTNDAILWEQDKKNNRWTYSYTATTSTVTDPNNHKHILTYDASGRAIQYEDTYHNLTKRSFDAANNVKSVTTARNNVWNFTYDASGNLLTLVNPFGTATPSAAAQYTTTLEYNADNTLRKVTDPMGHATQFTYDGNFGLLTITDGENHTTTFEGNLDGTLHAITAPPTPDGTLTQTHRTVFDYDGDGNVTVVTDPNNHHSTAGYDRLGRVTNYNDALGHGGVIAYDPIGRVKSLTDATDVYSPNYDAAMNMVGWGDSFHHANITEFDNCLRPKKTTQANGDVITYLWDGKQPDGTVRGGQLGLLGQFVDGNGHATIYSYYDDDSLSKVNYADGTSETYLYDVDGNLASVTDPNGTTITYQYDIVGQMNWIHHDGPLGPSYATNYTWDRAGRLFSTNGNFSEINAALTSTLYTYDNSDRLKRITTTGSLKNSVLDFVYDDADRLLSQTLTPSGGTAQGWQYAYDAADRLNKLTNPFSEITSFTYDDADKLTSVVSANHVSALYGYDGADRVQTLQYVVQGNAPISTITYGYDNLGNITSDSSRGGITYGYDLSGQLTREVGSNWSRFYSYDHNGNRAIKWTNAPGLNWQDTYTYDSADKLLFVDRTGGANSGRTAYGYNNNGDCTSVKLNNVTTALLTYGLNGVVRTISQPTAHLPNGNALPSSQFVYNELGLRRQKTDSAGVTGYVYDGVLPGSGLLQDNTATYTPGLSERRGTSSLFYQTDLLGSIRTFADSTSAANAVATRDYDAWGNLLASTGSSNGSPFGFAGGWQYQTDGDTGLLLLGHRYYDASIGRFLSQDPAQQGNNWYAYADNNPVNEIDPEGLQGWLSNKNRPKIKYSSLTDELTDLLGWWNDTPVGKFLAGFGGLGLDAESVANAPDQMEIGPGNRERPWKEEAWHGPKPKYENPGHHDPSSPNFRGGGSRTSVLPSDAAQTYRRAVPDPNSNGNTWYGRGGDGSIYRYQTHRDGYVHWNGSTAGARGVRVPPYIQKRLRR